MKRSDRTFVDIRLSHLLRDCSVGAIVRHGKALMVVQDTRDWCGPSTMPHEREIRYVELVRRTLGLGNMKLCHPPVKERKGKHVQGWVPARRFPEWTRCNRCGLLHNRPWRTRGQSVEPTAGREEERKGDGEAGAVPEVLHCCGPAQAADRTADRVTVPKEAPRERRCGGILEQVPWVLVHENGYLADVPWHAIAHDSARNPERRTCRPNRTEPYLKVESREGRWWVRCCRCRAEGRLPGRFPFGAKTRQQPWVRKLPPEAPDQPGWLVGVNDVRVHYPECRTALVIPPESRIRRGSVVDRLYDGNPADQDSVRTARNELARNGRLRRLARKYRCPVEEIKSALREIGRFPLQARKLPRGELAPLEYRALTEAIPDLRPDEDFVTEHHSEAWRALGGNSRGLPAAVAAAVDRLVAVHRVKEILVFEGFRRGWGSGDEGRRVPPHIEGESDWLPALELWGEGLFFTFREEVVRRWENQESVRARAAAFVERSVQARLSRDVRRALSPRFLLCHTVAHLVIRRLEAHAGYPAASLKERIYCDHGGLGGGHGADAPMAGILIYVAVADEHGSLGGLMDLAQPKRFLRLLTGAVEDASWCSFDPVCAEQEGHGPDLLNRAACHSCALVPEPSCICGNRLLDRAFVKADGEGMQSLWDVATGGEDRS